MSAFDPLLISFNSAARLDDDILAASFFDFA